MTMPMPVTLKDPIVKSFIFDLVTFTDEVDDKGASVKRASYPKDFLRGVNEVKMKIISTLEAGYVTPVEGKTTFSQDEVEWVPFAQINTPGFKEPEGKKFINQRQTDLPIELSSNAIIAVRYFYKVRLNVPEIPDSSLNTFEELFLDAKERTKPAEATATQSVAGDAAAEGNASGEA